MKLFTKQQITILDENGRASHPIGGQYEPEYLKPVVKLFTPDSQATWLLVSTDPHYPEIAYGLADLGLGCPELGDICLNELTSVKGPLGLPVERDRHFTPTKTLGEYAKEAARHGRITV